MAFLAPVLPSLISAGASLGASALMGGRSAPSATENFQPTGIDAGGLLSRITKKGNVGINVDPKRLGLVNSVASLFPEEADLVHGLRDSVAPGISQLRASRLQQIDDARRSAIGNLRENLSRRRVLGSSFGQDAITRAESEFAGQRESVAADSFLKEFELTNQMIAREFDLHRSEFTTKLDELNLEANIATKLAGAATEQLGANARIQSQLEAQAAAGQGKFFNETLSPVFKQLGTSVGGLFKTA
jgi:hypothetical protein